MFRLDDKVAAVVGAASGIGQAIAVALGRQGACVTCLDIDLPGAEGTAATVRAGGGEARAAALDVRSSTAVDAALADVCAAHGRIDVVVATPGINVRKPMVEYTDEDYDAVMDVNLRGTFHVLRAAGRAMAAQGSGSMIVISSISSRVVEPGQVLYAGTKAALTQMVRVAAAELGPFGVRVNAIAPGPVETPLTAPIRDDPRWRDAYAERVAVGRWARPEEIAAPAVFLASDEASYVSGSVVFADGGWTDLDQRFQGASVHAMAEAVVAHG